MKTRVLGSLSLVLLLCALASCGDSGGDAGSETGELTGGAATEAATDTEPPAAEADCELEGACGEGAVCDVYPCGGRAARYNHFGCRRYACTADSDCPAGEACFTIAFDSACEPSDTTCAEESGACQCASTDDCDGGADSHCLPVEFYPTAEYCDPGQWTCAQLPQWIDALSSARDHHGGQGNTEIAERLSACLEQANAAAVACP